MSLRACSLFRCCLPCSVSLTQGETDGYHPLLRAWIAGELARGCEWYLKQADVRSHLPDTVLQHLDANVGGPNVDMKAARAAMFEFIFNDASRSDKSVIGQHEAYVRFARDKRMFLCWLCSRSAY